MTRHALLFAFAVFGSLLADAPARAADACKDATSTIQINACARQTQDAAERDLNTTYVRIRKALAQDAGCQTCLKARAALTLAQRTWVDFRKRDCDALYQYHADGTIAAATLSGCLAEHAKQRTAQLRSHFESDR